MKSDNRFLIESQSSNKMGMAVKVITDTNTGVQYLYVSSGDGGGLTLIVDKEGKPIINDTLIKSE